MDRRRKTSWIDYYLIICHLVGLPVYNNVASFRWTDCTNSPIEPQLGNVERPLC